MGVENNNNNNNKVNDDDNDKHANPFSTINIFQRISEIFRDRLQISLLTLIWEGVRDFTLPVALPLITQKW